MRPTRQEGAVWTLSLEQGRLDRLELLLEASGLFDRMRNARLVLVKPNLVDVLPPPITTPVDLVEALVRAIRARCQARIVVAEGTATPSRTTWQVFEALGYTAMAARLGCDLVDLNEEPVVERRDPRRERWPRMVLPAIVYEGFLLSVPVLKAHTLAGVTLTLKNMLGLAPPSHFQDGTSWRKSAFHWEIDAAIADLNHYRRPDFTVLDAREGMAASHLGGPRLEPPPGILLAGWDPVAMDAYAASLLGVDWRRVGHIRLLDGELGRAEPVTLYPVCRNDVGRLRPSRATQ